MSPNRPIRCMPPLDSRSTHPDILRIILPVAFRAATFVPFPCNPIANMEICLKNRRNQHRGFPVGTYIHRGGWFESRHDSVNGLPKPSPVIRRGFFFEEAAVIVFVEIIRGIQDQEIDKPFGELFRQRKGIAANDFPADSIHAHWTINVTDTGCESFPVFFVTCQGPVSSRWVLHNRSGSGLHRFQMTPPGDWCVVPSRERGLDSMMPFLDRMTAPIMATSRMSDASSNGNR